jgi:hypothetical protein
MRPLNDRSDAADAYLAAFRRERPGAATRARNWEAIARRRAEPPAPVLVRARWRRAAVSVTAALAIAAAVLLLLRGVGLGLSTLSERARGSAMQAPDRAEPRPTRTLASPPARPHAPPAPVVETPTPPEPLLQRPVPRPAAAASNPDSAPPRDPASAPPRDPASAPPRDPDSTPPQDPTDALAEETRLVAAARRALSSSEPAMALEPLREHARRFPQGALAEEREAYVAIAHCRHQPPQPEAARRFLAAHAGSVHAPRVQAACGSEP